MSRIPLAGGQALIAHDLFLGPAWEAVLFAGNDTEAAESVALAFREQFLPNVLLIRASSDHETSPLLQTHLEGRSAVDNSPTLYLCERGRCEAPLAGAGAICERIESF
jgi:uncharacterized protein YyaL (SSP411 family)